MAPLKRHRSAVRVHGMSATVKRFFFAAIAAFALLVPTLSVAQVTIV
jgi:hypothetical protein